MKAAFALGSLPTIRRSSFQTCVVSVIVCTRGRPGALNRFIRSLNRQTRPADELVLVDASPDARTRQLAVCWAGRASYPIRYFHSDPGLTRQRNLGVRMAAGRYLLFFDDDVVLSPRYIEVVVTAFAEESSGRTGGVAGRIVNQPSQDVPTRLIKTLFLLSDQGGGKMKLSGFPSMPAGRRPARVTVMPGCCMAYSRAVFERFAFDENLTGYGYMEDVDFSSRVGRNFRLLYCPQAELEHHPSTFRDYDAVALRRMMIRHHVYLYRKNLPKTAVHLAAFVWSLLGTLAYNALLSRDLQACRGVLHGLFRK